MNQAANYEPLFIIVIGTVIGLALIIMLVEWMLNRKKKLEDDEEFKKAKEHLIKETNELKVNKEYNKLLKSQIDSIEREVNAFKTIEKKKFKKPTNIRLFEDKYNPEKYIIKNIELYTDKEFNYFFIYRLIKKYHLNMSVLAMPNPLVLKDKTNMLNPKRFIHAPEVTQIFKSIICQDAPIEDIHYIIKIDRDYNINIGCIIAKFDKLQWQLRNKIPLENYYSKTMSNIYTEMKEFIIECQIKYVDFLTQNGCK